MIIFLVFFPSKAYNFVFASIQHPQVVHHQKEMLSGKNIQWNMFNLYLFVYALSEVTQLNQGNLRLFITVWHRGNFLKIGGFKIFLFKLAHLIVLKYQIIFKLKIQKGRLIDQLQLFSMVTIGRIQIFKLKKLGFKHGIIIEVYEMIIIGFHGHDAAGLRGLLGIMKQVLETSIYF
ncbi:unnamed protein product (macronuclear) [Paramecium tetraurelia]|uniref:Transmembrane protein n=1 Tax=Paramecium tetraurelia TaxID=5888 RepID=A0EDY4_PARTE|nr:uncharacterized protein GSPATT00025845001 [Paramecium tetraurelia]CAK93501.1 unnamed protein product [Paramecium tetraurelia]|eukprot:XP_001460898.1 hypothetical protein (macronuclear) [Paramecium tetraurelia strain d4-2]